MVCETCPRIKGAVRRGMLRGSNYIRAHRMGPTEPTLWVSTISA